MEEIRSIINKVIGDIAGKNPDVHNKLDRIWKNLLSEQELKHTKLLGAKEETILVLVDSPAWLYQMRIRQSALLRQLKEDVPGIKYIRFKIGKTT